jgi:hypothetical protein
MQMEPKAPFNIKCTKYIVSPCCEFLLRIDLFSTNRISTKKKNAKTKLTSTVNAQHKSPINNDS